MIDAFLRLFNADGQPVEGESADHNFSRAIQVYEFGLCPSASDAQVSLAAIGNDARTSFLVDLHDKMKEWDAQKEAVAKRGEEQRRREQKQRREIVDRFQLRTMSGLDQVTNMVAEKSADNVVAANKSADDSRLSFKISKDADAASPDLFQAYCSTVFQPNPKKEYRKLGQFQKAEVSLRKMFDAGGPTTVPLPYLVVAFTDVAIDSYTLSYNSGRHHLTETVVFKFVGYRMQFTPQDKTGDTANAGLITSGTIAKKA